MIFGTHASIEKQQWFWTLDKFKKKKSYHIWNTETKMVPEIH